MNPSVSTKRQMTSTRIQGTILSQASASTNLVDEGLQVSASTDLGGGGLQEVATYHQFLLHTVSLTLSLHLW